jgi:single-stranded-DNA-specific exonuclease
MQPAFLGVEKSAKGRRWLARLKDTRLAEAISQHHELPDILGRVLAARGVDVAGTEQFLNPTIRTLMPQPHLFRDLPQAADRFAAAIAAREPIGIISDYDVDGVSSAALVQRYLRSLGHEARTTFPIA